MEKQVPIEVIVCTAQRDTMLSEICTQNDRVNVTKITKTKQEAKKQHAHHHGMIEM